MLPLIALLALLAATGPVKRQDRPTFPAETRQVYLDVFVAHRGLAVEGLTADNFEVRDDGGPAALEMVRAQELPMRTVLVFDTSGSVGRQGMRELAKAAKQVTDRLRPGDSVDLIPFDQRVRRAPVSDAAPAALLSQLSPSGGTALLDAVFAALVSAGPDRTLVIAFSDGEDNMSWLDERSLAEVARRSPAVLQGVSVGPAVSTDGSVSLESLRRICEATGGRLWTAPSAAELPRSFDAILDAMEQRYLLRFEPANHRPGWHRLDVRLRKARGTIRTRAGYWRPLEGPTTR